MLTFYAREAVRQHRIDAGTLRPSDTLPDIISVAEWRLAGASRSMAMDNVRPWPPAEEHVPAAGIAPAASAALAGDTSSAAGASDDLQTAMDEMDSAAEFLNDAIRSGLGRVSAVGGFELSEDAESVLQSLDDGTIPRCC